MFLNGGWHAPGVEAERYVAPDRRHILSHRRTTHRAVPKLTLVVAGSVIALAGASAGTAMAWPSGPGTSSASVADASTLTSLHAGRQAAAAVQDTVLESSVHQAKLAGAQARIAAQQEAIRDQAAARARRRAQQRAAAARAAAAAAAAKAAAARKAAKAQAASAAPAAQPAASPQGSPQQIAQGMLASYGWSSSQFSCLQPLWNRESGWNASASNPTSGAYGIPQALPGSKMASAGSDWQTNPATQIRWGLGYIKSTYGSPCAAWSHEQATGSY
ncbi:MAG TPA: lytic transglycosylase domain-containing protein [Streptosporangiaceae bacterium]|nr:lytic transglycosylase domain-containing protein [Streptosporangiaceae bacterium]